MYFQALDLVDISCFFSAMYLVEFVAGSQKQQRKREKMNLLKVQATEESPSPRIQVVFKSLIRWQNLR